MFALNFKKNNALKYEGKCVSKCACVCVWVFRGGCPPLFVPAVKEDVYESSSPCGVEYQWSECVCVRHPHPDEKASVQRQTRKRVGDSAALFPWQLQSSASFTGNISFFFSLPLMRQTGSFCPLTCVPSSHPPVLVVFFLFFSTCAHKGRFEGGGGGWVCVTAAYVFTLSLCWETKLLFCVLMWDSIDKCEKDCLPQLIDLHRRGKVKVMPPSSTPPPITLHSPLLPQP